MRFADICVRHNVASRYLLDLMIQHSPLVFRPMRMITWGAIESTRLVKRQEILGLESDDNAADIVAEVKCH